MQISQISKFFGILCLFFCISACGAQKVVLPEEGENADGSLTLSCDGPSSGWRECYKKASEQCQGRRYTILSSRTDTIKGLDRRALIVRCE